MLDTLRLARAIWPSLEAYGLDRLVEHTGITLGDDQGQRHRARFDAHATALLFVALAETVGNRDRLFSLASLARPSLRRRTAREAVVTHVVKIAVTRTTRPGRPRSLLRWTGR
ncbi:MAG: hypothetical protein ACRDYA_12350 [Egibacteraceae bacterium]